MSALPLASSFLAGAILTLIIPAAVFFGISIWHLGVAKKAHDLPVVPPQPPGTPPPVSDVSAPDV